MVHVEVVTQGDRVSLRQRGAPDVAFTFPHRRVQAAVIGWLASDPSFGCSMSQLHDENADVEPFVLIFHEPEVYEAHFTQLDQQLFSYALADGANHEQALPAHVADVLPLHRGVLLRTHDGAHFMLTALYTQLSQVELRVPSALTAACPATTAGGHFISALDVPLNPPRCGGVGCDAAASFSFTPSVAMRQWSSSDAPSSAASTSRACRGTRLNAGASRDASTRLLVCAHSASGGMPTGWSLWAVLQSPLHARLNAHSKRRRPSASAAGVQAAAAVAPALVTTTSCQSLKRIRSEESNVLWQATPGGAEKMLAGHTNLTRGKSSLSVAFSPDTLETPVQRRLQTALEAAPNSSASQRSTTSVGTRMNPAVGELTGLSTLSPALAYALAATPEPHEHVSGSAAENMVSPLATRLLASAASGSAVAVSATLSRGYIDAASVEPLLAPSAFAPSFSTARGAEHDSDAAHSGAADTQVSAFLHDGAMDIPQCTLVALWASPQPLASVLGCVQLLTDASSVNSASKGTGKPQFTLTALQGRGELHEEREVHVYTLAWTEVLGALACADVNVPQARGSGGVGVPLHLVPRVMASSALAMMPVTTVPGQCAARPNSFLVACGSPGERSGWVPCSRWLWTVNLAGVPMPTNTVDTCSPLLVRWFVDGHEVAAWVGVGVNPCVMPAAHVQGAGCESAPRALASCSAFDALQSRAQTMSGELLPSCGIVAAVAASAPTALAWLNAERNAQSSPFTASLVPELIACAAVPYTLAQRQLACTTAAFAVDVHVLYRWIRGEGVQAADAVQSVRASREAEDLVPPVWVITASGTRIVLQWCSDGCVCAWSCEGTLLLAKPVPRAVMLSHEALALCSFLAALAGVDAAASVHCAPMESATTSDCARRATVPSATAILPLLCEASSPVPAAALFAGAVQVAHAASLANDAGTSRLLSLAAFFINGGVHPVAPADTAEGIMRAARSASLSVHEARLPKLVATLISCPGLVQTLYTAARESLDAIEASACQATLLHTRVVSRLLTAGMTRERVSTLPTPLRVCLLASFAHLQAHPPFSWPPGISPTRAYAAIERADLSAWAAVRSSSVVGGEESAVSGEGGLSAPHTQRLSVDDALYLPCRAGRGLGVLTTQGTQGKPAFELALASLALAAVVNAATGVSDVSGGQALSEDADGLASLTRAPLASRLAADARLWCCAHALRSSLPRWLSAEQVQTIESDTGTEKNRILLQQARITMALPSGRALVRDPAALLRALLSPHLRACEFAPCRTRLAVRMRRPTLPLQLTANTVHSNFSDPVEVPVLTVAMRTPPKGALLKVDISHLITLTSGISDWTEFHNGYAAAMRIAPATANARNLPLRVRAWVRAHRFTGVPPDISAINSSAAAIAAGLQGAPTAYASAMTGASSGVVPPNPAHAGMLLAFGLKGFLNSFRSSDVYEYLSRSHALTTIGLLLGGAIGRRGSLDAVLSKAITLHLPSMLPTTHHDLDIPMFVQGACCLALGFLYEGSQHRLISEYLLTEAYSPLANLAGGLEKQEEVDMYAASAGFALGVVNLTPGSGHGVVTDLKLDNALLQLVVGGSAETVHAQLTSCGRATALAPSLRRAGPTINTGRTAPPALLALAIMYAQTNEDRISNVVSLPTHLAELEEIRFDSAYWRVLTRALIQWDELRSFEASYYQDVRPETAAPCQGRGVLELRAAHERQQREELRAWTAAQVPPTLRRIVQRLWARALHQGSGGAAAALMARLLSAAGDDDAGQSAAASATEDDDGGAAHTDKQDGALTDIDTAHMLTCYIMAVAGAVAALGVRFAGSGNVIVRDEILALLALPLAMRTVATPGAFARVHEHYAAVVASATMHTLGVAQALVAEWDAVASAKRGRSGDAAAPRMQAQLRDLLFTRFDSCARPDDLVHLMPVPPPAWHMAVAAAGDSHAVLPCVPAAGTASGDAFHKAACVPSAGVVRLMAALCAECLPSALNCMLIALCMVMAGSGDVTTLQTVRLVSNVSDLVRCTFGDSMATHTALGMLNAGGGSLTLRADRYSIPSLLALLHPIWPTGSASSSYWLQPARLLWPLALDPGRTVAALELRLDGGGSSPVSVPIAVRLHAPGSRTLRMTTPCHLPPLAHVHSIHVLSTVHEPFTVLLRAGQAVAAGSLQQGDTAADGVDSSSYAAQRTGDARSADDVAAEARAMHIHNAPPFVLFVQRKTVFGLAATGPGLAARHAHPPAATDTLVRAYFGEPALDVPL